MMCSRATDRIFGSKLTPSVTKNSSAAESFFRRSGYRRRRSACRPANSSWRVSSFVSLWGGTDGRRLALELAWRCASRTSRKSIRSTSEATASPTGVGHQVVFEVDAAVAELAAPASGLTIRPGIPTTVMAGGTSSMTTEWHDPCAGADRDRPENLCSGTDQHARLQRRMPLATDQDTPPSVTP